MADSDMGFKNCHLQDKLLNLILAFRLYMFRTYGSHIFLLYLNPRTGATILIKSTAFPRNNIQLKILVHYSGPGTTLSLASCVRLRRNLPSPWAPRTLTLKL